MKASDREARSPAQPPLDLDSILRRTHQVATEVVAPRSEQIDREARWPREGLQALQQAGLGGLVIPERAGGLGQGLYALAQVCEILGQECASTAMCFGMHSVGAAVLAAKATPDQQHRYLEPIAAGRHLTTLSLSEPGTGTHFYLPQAELRRLDPERYRVSGTKAFVTNGGFADSYVVSTVAADAGAPAGQFSCVVVPQGAPGLHWGPPWDGMGLRGNSSRSLELQGVEVPRHDLLGDEGDQIWYVFHVITPYFLTAMAGTYLGVASAAINQARDRMVSRHYSNSGSSLAQLPVLQHQLGTLWGVLERTRRLIYYAARSFDADEPDALACLFTAKAEVADCVVQVVNEAMTLTGGSAYRSNSVLHRLMRDARAAHVMSPTTDLLRIWTGRALLGQPILGG